MGAGGNTQDHATRDGLQKKFVFRQILSQKLEQQITANSIRTLDNFPGGFGPSDGRQAQGAQKHSKELGSRWYLDNLQYISYF